MSAEGPLEGPEGGRASATGAFEPSEGSLAAQTPHWDGAETAEGGEEACAAQEALPGGGSRPGVAHDGCGACSEDTDNATAAAAADELAALQLGGGDADGDSSGAVTAGEAAAAAGCSGSHGHANEAEEAAWAVGEGEEEGGGTIKAHGGPASAPCLGAIPSEVGGWAARRSGMCMRTCIPGSGTVARVLLQLIHRPCGRNPPVPAARRRACRRRLPAPPPSAAPASASPSQRRRSACWAGWAGSAVV